MADVTLTYKGNTIAELYDSGTKTIQTAGKYCEADIGLTYLRPSGSDGGGVIITDTPDANGGIIRTITAIEISGTKTIDQNGMGIDVTQYARVNVEVPTSGKNVQIDNRSASTSQTSYTDMGFEIVVSKAGTYDIYWTGFRTSTSGTNGAQIYKNGTSVGSAQTDFDTTYVNCQNGHISGVACSLNDIITIRARSSTTSNTMYVMNLIIIES